MGVHNLDEEPTKTYKEDAWRPNDSAKVLYCFRHGSSLCRVLCQRAARIHEWINTPFTWDKLLIGLATSLPSDVYAFQETSGAVVHVRYALSFTRAACEAFAPWNGKIWPGTNIHLMIRLQLTKWNVELWRQIRVKGSLLRQTALYTCDPACPLGKFILSYGQGEIGRPDEPMCLRYIVFVVGLCIRRAGGIMCASNELVYLTGDLRILFGGPTMIAKNEIKYRLLCQLQVGGDARSDSAPINAWKRYAIACARLRVNVQFAYAYSGIPEKFESFLKVMGVSAQNYNGGGEEEPKIPACFVVEAVLKYIEMQQCHDPANPRVVLPDESLRKLLSPTYLNLTAPVTIEYTLDRLKDLLPNVEESEYDEMEDCGPYNFRRDYRFAADNPIEDNEVEPSEADTIDIDVEEESGDTDSTETSSPVGSP